MIVHVTQTVGDDEVELAVTLDGDGGIARVDWADDRTKPLPTELDWLELADEARDAVNAKLRGWP